MWRTQHSRAQSTVVRGVHITPRLVTCIDNARCVVALPHSVALVDAGVRVAVGGFLNGVERTDLVRAFDGEDLVQTVEGRPV